MIKYSLLNYLHKHIKNAFYNVSLYVYIKYIIAYKSKFFDYSVKKES